MTSLRWHSPSCVLEEPCSTCHQYLVAFWKPASRMEPGQLCDLILGRLLRKPLASLSPWNVLPIRCPERTASLRAASGPKVMSRRSTDIGSILHIQRPEADRLYGSRGSRSWLCVAEPRGSVEPSRSKFCAAEEPISFIPCHNPSSEKGILMQCCAVDGYLSAVRSWLTRRNVACIALRWVPVSCSTTFTADHCWFVLTFCWSCSHAYVSCPTLRWPQTGQTLNSMMPSENFE